jgi:hypothetical protein
VHHHPLNVHVLVEDRRRALLGTAAARRRAPRRRLGRPAWLALRAGTGRRSPAGPSDACETMAACASSSGGTAWTTSG